MKIKKFKHIFVEEVPERLKNGMLYICLQCNVVVHKCACGCGEKVVLPLDPSQWRLIYNGVDVSMEPSIGNWSYKCKSHYFIKHNRVKWSFSWDEYIRNEEKD